MAAAADANVNQMMIRGLFQNTAVIILFVMPMITMRTYSEEKRSGTIELLLTSPVTDLEIIIGKFIGALALYAAMLLVTMLYMLILFKIGNPEWRPLVAGYLGLLLMGGCFLSTGLFISSLTKNQIVAGFLTFATFLMLWIINWLGESSEPDDARCAELPVDHRALRRLRARHHRHQARRVLPQLHHVWTVPDGQVGRQRAVAWIAVIC